MDGLTISTANRKTQMEDHNESLKRKRSLSTSNENNDANTVGPSSSSELGETTCSTCYGTVK